MDEVWKEFTNRIPQQLAQPADDALQIVLARGRQQVTSDSCLCGKVAREFSAEVRGVVHCHCISCRKVHGSAFSGAARVQAAEFRLTGDKYPDSFESSSAKHRSNCSNCGTHIYAECYGRDLAILCLGLLDTQLGAR